MKLYTKSPLSVLCLIFTFITLFSCSKDSDLLTDYVSLDPEVSLYKYVVNDTYQISISNNPEDESFEITVNSGGMDNDASGGTNNTSGGTVNDTYQTSSSASIVLDVLVNDTFNDLDNVSIIESSQPENGEVVINSDNTLTYTPLIIEPSEETFTYTTEFIDEAGKVVSEIGIVTITTFISGQDSKILSADILYWKELFDEYWNDPDYDMSKISQTWRGAINLAKSANYDQEYYRLAYQIDGLIKIWQATGDNKYLEECLEIIYITINEAKPISGGYLGWPTIKDSKGTPLWDSYYWRFVATLTRIMYKSPNLLASQNERGGIYNDDFEKLLNFGEKNIWDRYESYGLNSFYRSRTHMSSHWARIGLEFYIITGKSKYKEVFDNISNGEMYNRPSNLRNQFFTTQNNPNAILWDSSWGVPKGTDIQDTSHAGAIVSFWVVAVENNFYWNQNDMTGLINTVNNIIWKPTDGPNVKVNIDGSGGYHTANGRLHEWLTLGRFDRQLQNRIKSNYTDKNSSYFGTQLFGIAALNEKILTDGRPVYPENN